MKGYLTTCDGAQFELPTLLKWEFSYTGSVPCDSFTLRCAYEPAMAEVLRRAVRRMPAMLVATHRQAVMPVMRLTAMSLRRILKTSGAALSLMASPTWP